MSGIQKATKQQVTLKRRVTIKAVVTDKFKEYLLLELSENLQQAERRLKEIESTLTASQNPAINQQLNKESKQIKDSLSQLPKQKEAIEKLKNDTFFSQGVIEGFVSVSIGDNLYEKLGAMEIVVKDGVVQELTPVPSMPNFQSVQTP